MKIGRANDKEALTILLVPARGGRPRTIRITRRWLPIALVALCGLVATLILSFGTLGQVGKLTVTIARLRHENARLREERQKFAKLEGELLRLRLLEKRLASMLNMDKGGRQSDPVSRAGMLGQPENWLPDGSDSIPTMWPVRGEISQGFSEAPRGHKGIDIAVSRGTPVKAAGHGIVGFAGQDQVFGNMLIVKHGSGISSVYAHNSKLAVAAGDRVRKGQVIAYSGSSGRSSAPHLHFEVSRYGKQLDPLTFLSEH